MEVYDHILARNVQRLQIMGYVWRTAVIVSVLFAAWYGFKINFDRLATRIENVETHLQRIDKKLWPEPAKP